MIKQYNFKYKKTMYILKFRQNLTILLPKIKNCCIILLKEYHMKMKNLVITLLFFIMCMTSISSKVYAVDDVMKNTNEYVPSVYMLDPIVDPNSKNPIIVIVLLILIFTL